MSADKKYILHGTLKGLDNDGADDNYVIVDNCNTKKECFKFILENNDFVKDWDFSERVEGKIERNTLMTRIFYLFVNVLNL